MRKFLLVLIAAGLVGCFNLKQYRVTPEYRALKNKAAIVVFLDPSPRLHHLQLSPKDSTATTAALEGWDAGVVTTKFLAKRMRAMGLEVKTLTYTHRDFPNPYDSSMAYPNFERTRGALADWGKQNDVDMVVAVYRQVEKDFIGESVENMVGYGVARHAHERIDAYAAVYLEALETGSAAMIGNSDGLATIPLDEALWREEFNVDKTPVPIEGKEAAAMIAKITEALTGAVMLAAQEAGLSH
ncbi:MAG: hypothetical protein EXR86_13155 [Gammaproteobacteria bacterium]|nr:hypothetical protein [Gammaproteobacteria bacterium]